MTTTIERTALVTGGTDGVGKAVACRLARLGHRVLVVGRDRDRGRLVEQELRSTTGNGRVYFMRADLGLIREGHRLAREVGDGAPSLHCLVHSAGIVRGRRVLTDEGIESNFAVNYLGRFVLTNQLLPALRAAGAPGRAARIVVVSGASRGGKVDLDDVNLTRRFTTFRAVRQFCAANDLFTAELARRLTTPHTRPRVTITCLKLGVVKTNIRREFPRWMKLLVPLVMDPLLGQTPDDAADAVLQLLIADEFEGQTGELFLKIRRLQRTARRDGRDQDRLWTLSEQIVATALAAASPTTATDEAMKRGVG
jgi:NAD(P)-dependent dehydrogenase (short-subunit alcohol dehydrogenase family)